MARFLFCYKRNFSALILGFCFLLSSLSFLYFMRQQKNVKTQLKQPINIVEQTLKTPKPPSQLQWESPLIINCHPADLRLRAHLLSMPLRIKQIKAHPTNFGLRLGKDLYSQRLNPNPTVIVLHETVYDLDSAVNTLLTPHTSDVDQVSYHTLVGRSGDIVQLVDPSFRAYGAGHSAFNGRWVFSNRNLSGSLNNFALHVSLETPRDGSNNLDVHSGYSPSQYDALARVLADWMVRYKVPATSITTHRYVDLGGARADPRSFAWSELQKRLTALQLVCN